MNTSDFFSSRREFMQTLAIGTTGLVAGVSSTPAVAGGGGSSSELGIQAEAWIKKVKGKHRIIYDATEPHDGFPIIWSWAFYKTNNETGSPDSDLTAMVVLRHNAIPLAMEDRLWEKYKFGEMFKITDMTTNAPALRNPYWTPTDGPFKALGIDGMKRLQERGVMFCVCDLALTVYSMRAAQSIGVNAEEVKKDWLSGLNPGVQPVPSGVWAVNRAQERGCSYCYAGG
ncbi:MAG TPA: Tat (twin-arginine translocation) pathway signal sequence containing protein [Chryseosolibacter sp.]|nr:Tat (twin-arginine translocation) pathway signal sequence containing protein [Chryseosolibacter sp.]